MKWVFWSAAAVIGYTYFGYPAWLWLLSRWHARPVRVAPYLTSISIVMVIRNEASILERKLENLLKLNYPAERTEILVVSDASTDGSNEVLRRFADVSRLRVLLNPQALGKPSGLNRAIGTATGEIVVFTDARQEIETDAIPFLLENFADSRVGCVSGELMLGNPACGETIERIGGYWRIEKKIREMESSSGSVVGATGALYAVRRHLLPEVPPETILDDVYIPMHVVRCGARVVFDPRARAWDIPDQGTEREFARKVRTLSGNYQLLQLSPWLLSSTNPLRFRFASHKLARLLIPFALIMLFISSVMLSGLPYRVALAAQLIFYGLVVLALIGAKRGLLGRAADAAFTVVLLNTAAAVAFANFTTGRKVVWSRQAG